VRAKGHVKGPVKTSDIPEFMHNDLRNFRFAAIGESLRPLLDKDEFTVHSLGEIKIKDRPAIGVRVVRKDRSEMGLYFDKQSHLLVRTERRGIHPRNGNEQTIATVLESHKKFGELIYPTKIRVVRDNEVDQELEVTNVEFVESYPENFFTRPKS
jgi:hypothetical protein